MWIKVRSMDGLQSRVIDGLSKLTKVEDLRGKLVRHFDAPTDRQRLFFRGKQMEDGHTLFEYNVNVNDTIQLMLKPLLTERNNGHCRRSSDSTPSPCSPSSPETDEQEQQREASSCHHDEANKENGTAKKFESPTKPGDKKTPPPVCTLQRSEYFKIRDAVDAKDMGTGAWFEATVVGISAAEDGEPSRAGTSQSPSRTDLEDDGVIYHVSYDDYREDEPTALKLSNLRPRAQHVVPFDDIAVGEMVMVNYNVEDPGERGFWYDARVTAKEDARINKKLFATVYIGGDATPLVDCKILYVEEVFRIEKLSAVSGRGTEAEETAPVKRKNKIECKMCMDKVEKRCHFCACHVCGGKNDPAQQIMCDECDFPFHIWCLDPPLESVPQEDEWYCPGCKVDASEVVRAGEKLKESKKKSKMASASSSCKRDWGKGMACAGRTKECTIVPLNHFGPIPGVEVGSTWRFRVQVSESGVHRPHVAGISGRENIGAFSLVLAGGYEDDVDNGGEFTYTGSGGRDLSGNKRTAEQSWDQTLTRMNRALALNCDAPIDDENGAVARNWQRGKPVRVVRSQKGRKHSDYCPEEGVRYDGIYKIVKYWPEKGMSGYLVWRFLLRRDDPVPAPWTKAGQDRMRQLGLKIQYPEGYLEANGLSEEEHQVEEEESARRSSARKGKLIVKLPVKKRKLEMEESPRRKSGKKEAYVLPSAVLAMVNDDERNERVWKECEKLLADGRQAFLRKVEEVFLCPCCQDLVAKPVTTKCLHNICKACLIRAVKAKMLTCPACRTDVGAGPDLMTNDTLDEILRNLFPGYETGR